MAFTPAGVWRATSTPAGPGREFFESIGNRIQVSTWGPGAEWLIEAAPELVGLHDDPSALRAVHQPVHELHRRLGGLRIGRARAVIEVLIPTILEQKVVGAEARRSYRKLVRAYGEPAPGPSDISLMVPPSPKRLATLPYYEFHPFGIERKRADIIRTVCRSAERLEQTLESAPEEAARKLMSISGIGPWSAAEVATLAFGDVDAVRAGDYHLPHLVAWVLAGEPRATDERMFELLSPYAGQRGRVVRLIEVGGSRPARRGPRARLRRIERV